MRSCEFVVQRCQSEVRCEHVHLSRYTVKTEKRCMPYKPKNKSKGKFTVANSGLSCETDNRCFQYYKKLDLH